ncbi:MAG: TIM-barrel domain-containing protein [Flavonifractor plautii]
MEPEPPDTPIVDPELTWDTTTATEIDITGDPIVIQTDGMRIEISRTPCRMTVMQADGTTLFWEPESGGIYHDGVRFVRAESSNMYGIHGFDCFSDNGNLLRNDNSSTAAAGQQGNSGGPFMWSTAGYGIPGGWTLTAAIPIQTPPTGKMEFYYGGTPAEGRRYEKEDVEYFIMLGEPKEIMAGFSKITGTSPMMPKWSLGFSNFEWDIDEDEFYEMVELYRAKNIPIDGYAFDYDWKRYGDDNYGEFTWNTDNFLLRPPRS